MSYGLQIILSLLAAGAIGLAIRPLIHRDRG